MSCGGRVGTSSSGRHAQRTHSQADSCRTDRDRDERVMWGRWTHRRYANRSHTCTRHQINTQMHRMTTVTRILHSFRHDGCMRHAPLRGVEGDIHRSSPYSRVDHDIIGDDRTRCQRWVNARIHTVALASVHCNCMQRGVVHGCQGLRCCAACIEQMRVVSMCEWNDSRVACVIDVIEPVGEYVFVSRVW